MNYTALIELNRYLKLTVYYKKDTDLHECKSAKFP